MKHCVYNGSLVVWLSSNTSMLRKCGYLPKHVPWSSRRNLEPASRFSPSAHASITCTCLCCHLIGQRYVPMVIQLYGRVVNQSFVWQQKFSLLSYNYVSGNKIINYKNGKSNYSEFLYYNFKFAWLILNLQKNYFGISKSSFVLFVLYICTFICIYLIKFLENWLSNRKFPTQNLDRYLSILIWKREETITSTTHNGDKETIIKTVAEELNDAKIFNFKEIHNNWYFATITNDTVKQGLILFLSKSTRQTHVR